MKLQVVVFACVAALGLANCTGPRPPINPPQLVSSNETDLAIQLFVQATIMMAKYYGFETKSYAEISDRSLKAGFNSLPFMPPVTVSATRPMNWEVVAENLSPADFKARVDAVAATNAIPPATPANAGEKLLLKYYIKTGWKASQIVCRNYLLGSEERNRYLEFLRDELGVGFGVAGTVLALTSANGALKDSFTLAHSAIDGGISTYEKYRFSIDPEAARVLVETAQNKYAVYFMRLVDKPKIPTKTGDAKDEYDPVVPFTFSEALSAVSTIEFQCTRSGMARLLNRAINNTPTNMDIDDLSGDIYFPSSKSNTASPGSPRAESSINSSLRAIAAARNAAKDASVAAAAAKDAATAAAKDAATAAKSVAPTGETKPPAAPKKTNSVGVSPSRDDPPG
jgi:hypothetical protein